MKMALLQVEEKLKAVLPASQLAQEVLGRMQAYTDFDDENNHMSEHNIAYDKRTLTPEEEGVVKKLAENKQSYSELSGFVTVTQDVKLVTWNKKHPAKDNMEETIVPAGTTLRICTLSRFNDFGLTDEVDTTSYGYKTRIPVDSALLSDIRLQKEPSSYHLQMKAVVDATSNTDKPIVDG
jgi:hypothetical protein